MEYEDGKALFIMFSLRHFHRTIGNKRHREKKEDGGDLLSPLRTHENARKMIEEKEKGRVDCERGEGSGGGAKEVM